MDFTYHVMVADFEFCIIVDIPVLVELLRSKLTKANEDLDTLESVEAAAGRVQKNLQNLQSEVPAFYVWGENTDTTEALLKGVKSQVEDSVSEGKSLISKTKDKYNTSQQLVPTDISQQLSALELLSETVSGAMEEKDRELKRARTVRADYKRDVEEVQTWIQKAELKVQDRSVEPLQLKEYLTQIQSEIGGISDKLDCLTKNGHVVMEQTNKNDERELIQSTINNLTEQLAQVKSWLEEKKLQVGESLDSWQRFMTLYKTVKSWVEEKQVFLSEPLQLSSLTQARQKLHDYSNAVKSCKQASKNLSDMSKELETISQVTSVGDLPEKLEEAEEAKGEVENQLLERNALLQETSEEWEQCEKKMKDVRSFIDKSRQALESPQIKKRTLRDQLSLREKMLSDITIQKNKISISVEKLQVGRPRDLFTLADSETWLVGFCLYVCDADDLSIYTDSVVLFTNVSFIQQLHFRSGVGGDSKVSEAAEEILKELDQLTGVVKEQSATLESCLTQLDQYQQEIQQLRQQIIQVEQQLRVVLSPTYSPHDREKAVEEQNVSTESVVPYYSVLWTRAKEVWYYCCTYPP
ncbi:hypothetical protein ANN_22002 [Periplaneta americana]|uniref:Uncharacterized protein n=1 Tax=Periplaneta americana TaxID=6978 RepID=A0ABQ8S773_PERAM|nr:hypothetical protein ANN_22002 [Periplaneta americana]